MDLLLNNTVYLLYLTMLLVLTIYPYAWVKVLVTILSTLYGLFLWFTGQYIFLVSLFFIETFLLYSLAKTVFHLF
jgi:hypothetical protein